MFSKNDEQIEDEEELLKELMGDENDDGGQYEYNKENKHIENSDEKYDDRHLIDENEDQLKEYEEQKEIFA